MPSLKDLGLDKSNVADTKQWVGHPIDVLNAEKTRGKYGEQVRLTIHAVGAPNEETYQMFLAENPRRLAMVQHFAHQGAMPINNIVLVKMDTGKGNPAYIFIDYADFLEQQASADETTT